MEVTLMRDSYTVRCVLHLWQPHTWPPCADVRNWLSFMKSQRCAL